MPYKTPIKRGDPSQRSRTNVTVDSIVGGCPAFEGETDIIGWSGGSTPIGVGVSVTFDGTAPAGYVQRRAFYISNLDPNSRIDLLDADDNFCLAVFPQTSITLPFSGLVKVKNNTGAEISAYVSEVFYVSS